MICQVDIHLLLLYIFNNMYTVSARQIQREYKKLFEKANKIKEPIIVISNNKLKGAIIGLDLLEKIRLEAAVNEALQEDKEGKTVSITNEKELDEYLKEMKKEAING